MPAPRAADDHLRVPAAPCTDSVEITVEHARRLRPRAIAVAAGATAGLLALSVGLGAAITTHLQFGLLAPAVGSDVPVAVPGSNGLVPGGPPLSVHLAGAPAAASGRFTVAPDGAALPAGCPATAWIVRAASTNTPETIAGSGTGAGPAPITNNPRLAAVRVGLAPDAPWTCQGFSAPLPLTVVGIDSGEQLHVHTTEPVTVSVLGTAGLSLEHRDGTVIALPMAPLSGPQPETFEVEVFGDSGWAAACVMRGPAACATPDPGRRYRVTVGIGAWRRSSAPISWAADPGDMPLGG